MRASSDLHVVGKVGAHCTDSCLIIVDKVEQLMKRLSLIVLLKFRSTILVSCMYWCMYIGVSVDFFHFVLNFPVVQLDIRSVTNSKLKIYLHRDKRVCVAFIFETIVHCTKITNEIKLLLLRYTTSTVLPII